MSGSVSVSLLKREFVDNKAGTKFPDPNTEWNPTQVRDFYSAQYPHLVNAAVEGPEIGKDKVTYKFVTTVGTKG